MKQFRRDQRDIDKKINESPKKFSIMSKQGIDEEGQSDDD